MSKFCAASFCRKRFLTQNDIRVPFPPKHDEYRRSLWQKLLLAGNASVQYVCIRHFSEKQLRIKRSGKGYYLVRNAIPDKNIISRTPNIKDPLDAVCRLCLERSTNDYQLIFPVWPDPDVPTAEEIAELFHIEINPDDVIPRIICVTCSSKIKYIKRIREQFKKNDAILRERFATQIEQADVSRKSKKRNRTDENAAVQHLKNTHPKLESSRNETASKITAITGFDKSPIAVPSTAIGSLEASGSVASVQDGAFYQYVHTTENRQATAVSELVEDSCTFVKKEPLDIDNEKMTIITEQEKVAGISIKVEPLDIDPQAEMAYTDDVNVPLESSQVKDEYPDSTYFGSLRTKEDHESDDEVEQPFPKKQRRTDMPINKEIERRNSINLHK